MKISVIIPTYNRCELLKRALKSVISQDFFEVVVVDDAGSDGTEGYMKQFTDNPKVVYLRCAKNRGVNVARNLGIRKARGEWIACLDDDDEFLPNAAEIMNRYLLELPSSHSVAFFNSLIKKEEEEFTGGFQFEKLKGKMNFYDPSYQNIMTKFNLIGDCKPVFRKSLFDDKKYLFPETVNGFESYTMNLISRDGKGIRYFKEVTTLIHQEPQLKDRLSINAPRKNPWPLLVLHTKQIPQHWRFYLRHPFIFLKKLIEMIKLLVRATWVFVTSLFS